MSNKKSPAGVGAPDKGENKNTQPNNITHWPWMASADPRCWRCKAFKADECNGLIDYNWRDCPQYRRRRNV